MFIIADSRLPKEARIKLELLGTVAWMPEQESVYPSIAAHPDIFFCQAGSSKVIAAPNAPKLIVEQMVKNDIEVIIGNKPVGYHHPETASYNAVFTDDFFIHNTKYSDKKLLEQVGDKTIIHVKQGYTRCNLLPLTNTSFLCSDRDIEKSLKKHQAKALFVRPEEIRLPGAKYGFIGGCCGIIDETVVITGSLNTHFQKSEISSFIKQNKKEILELYNGALWDGGSIFFLK